MFCPKCGTESLDDSQFCRKCGNALATGSSVSVAPASDRTKPSRVALFFAVLAVVAALGWFIDRANHPGPVSPIQQNVSNSYQAPPQPQLHTMTLGKGALSVAAMRYSFYTLPVPAGAHNIRVQGHFEATGGSGNDIEVFLLNDEQFTNWKNRHATPTYYTSGKVTVGDVQAALPDGDGTYYLVFNNNFSMMTAKAIEFTGTMNYYQ